MVQLEDLHPSEFADFYREIHGRRPYRWQERAARELVVAGPWSSLTAPTGSGKTTLVECFLFALGCMADVHPRPMPLRLFWVVDRRNVVDQVFVHACAVVDAIDQTSDGVAGRVGSRLRALAVDSAQPEASAVQVRLWRGALADQSHTVGPRVPLAPGAPAIVCSTVDQVGSRMLFRGYGVGRASRPIEAAMTGTDSLIVLDEAHLSAPFQSTARAVANASDAMEPVAPRLQVLPISATLGDKTAGSFELEEDERSEPDLARRLGARKLVRLASGAAQDKTLAREARRLADEGAHVVGVVTNTVGVARAVFEMLRGSGPSVLLIGPTRPLDRIAVLAQIPERCARDTMPAPLYVVGTQTLEVGLDLDFDALATACAPFSAMVQRLGRLDRSGKLGESRAVVVQPPKRCPVYGESTAQTWAWLQERADAGEVDMGPAGCVALQALDPPPPPRGPRAPIFGPWHIEALMQTSHDPVPSPDVSVFLHGDAGLDLADVQVCWRADVAPLTNHGAGGAWVERLRQRRPHPDELLSLSLPAVRRWLAQADQGDLADVESLGPVEERSPRGGRPAIRVPPPDGDGHINPTLVYGNELRPGDILAVPSSYGCCDEFGWAPGSDEVPVTDLGNLARGRSRVLLSRRLGATDSLAKAAADAVALLVADELSEEEAYDSLLAEVREWLASGASLGLDTPRGRRAAEIADDLQTTGRAIALADTGDDLLLVSDSPARVRRHARVRYADHVRAVERRATIFAERLGLPSHLVAAVRLAARYHDSGKLDPRFQSWLHDGSPGDPDSPLAKSGRSRNDPRARAARAVSGWPLGKRHEAISAALLSAVPGWADEVDADLLMHLVASHHGDGRPFRRAVADPESVAVSATIEGHEVSVGSDQEVPWVEHVDRFLRLTRRFGPWGLAALESSLVLADRIESAAEAE